MIKGKGSEGEEGKLPPSGNKSRKSKPLSWQREWNGKDQQREWGNDSRLNTVDLVNRKQIHIHLHLQLQ